MSVLLDQSPRFCCAVGQMSVYNNWLGGLLSIDVNWIANARQQLMQTLFSKRSLDDQTFVHHKRMFCQNKCLNVNMID
jgi:hypothetical protein